MVNTNLNNNYYPFGGSHKGYNNVVNGVHHPYGFGGKEEQDELGLGWIDITARNYDPALGRWMNLDPLAELMGTYSPYNYAFNNPIYYIDTDGLSPYSSIGYIDNLQKKDPDDCKCAVEIIPEVILPTVKKKEVILPIVKKKKVKADNGETDGVNIWGLSGGHEMSNGRSGRTSSVDATDFGMGGGASTASTVVNFIRKLWSLIFKTKTTLETFPTLPNQSTMEDKVEKEAEVIPEEIKVVITVDIINHVAPPYGRNGLRITKTTTHINAFAKDTARIKAFYRKKIDSVNNKIVYP